MNRKALIHVATEQLGIIEGANNSTKYGEWYGVNNVAWCGCFVSYVCYHSGNPLPKIDRDEGFHYVPTLYARAKQKGWLTDEPKEGDIIIFDWNGDGKHDHTGFFVGFNGNKVVTIEGNTSPDHQGSQSNGGGVYRRLRDKKFCTFVSLEKLLQ